MKENKSSYTKMYLGIAPSIDRIASSFLCGYPCLLFSYYYVSKSKKVLQSKYYRKMLENKDVIIDSGIFTLTYSDSKRTLSEKNLDDYYNGYIDFCKEYVPPHVKVIEFDCQRLFGVKKAWSYRMDMRKRLPNHTVLNVWHFEDRLDGLDEMARFSQYLCLPSELIKYESVKTCKKIQERIHSLSDVRIHILGTSNKNCCIPGITTSVDCTSWLDTRFSDLHSRRKETVLSWCSDKKEECIERIKKLPIWEEDSNINLNLIISYYNSMVNFIRDNDLAKNTFINTKE